MQLVIVCQAGSAGGGFTARKKLARTLARTLFRFSSPFPLQNLNPPPTPRFLVFLITSAPTPSQYLFSSSFVRPLPNPRQLRAISPPDSIPPQASQLYFLPPTMTTSHAMDSRLRPRRAGVVSHLPTQTTPPCHHAEPSCPPASSPNINLVRFLPFDFIVITVLSSRAGPSSTMLPGTPLLACTLCRAASAIW